MLEFKTRAREALLQAGFHPDFPPDVLAEVAKAGQNPPAGSVPPRDLRQLLWSSIDNDTSRDLDQIEYVEPSSNGAVRLLVGIADVDSLVPQGTATDRHAAAEATSVYLGVATFPMLPEQLSTNRTSLLDSQDRLALILEMQVSGNGEVAGQDVYPAWVRNAAKLAYSSTGAWLEGRSPAPTAVAQTPGLAEQLQLQRETAGKLRTFRKQHGALTFGSTETTPVIRDGIVEDLAIAGHTVAQDLIESFMIAANVAMAGLLKAKGSLALRRVVRTPKRWDRIQAIAAPFGVTLPSDPDPRALAEFLDARRQADPDHFPDLSLTIVKLLGPGEYVVESPGTEHEGHFGLAVQDYTHSTAPNRRFADLVTQRLLKATFNGGSPPYAETELKAIADHCTERDTAARKAERLMGKVIAASLLSKRLGQIFSGIVTGASEKGTYVRLVEFPAEGRVVRGAQGIDVGDKVRVRLLSVDVNQGFIDFEHLAP